MTHNHPSGDPTPSSADVQMTRQINDIARPLGITVHAIPAPCLTPFNSRTSPFQPPASVSPHTPKDAARLLEQARAFFTSWPRAHAGLSVSEPD